MSRKKPSPDERQSQAIVPWTYQWLEAVDRQAHRVFTAPNSGAGQIEILLFVMALRNLLRGAERILGAQHHEVSAFLKRVPNAKVIRDMLEHFDDYLIGSGDLQKNGEHTVRWNVSYSSDVLDSDDPEIGERVIHINGRSLDVGWAAEAVRPLAQAAIKAAGSRLVANAPPNGSQKS
jgi:hypothetical protein